MLKGKQIFIVEDDTMNRVVYTMILKKEGVILEFDRFGRDTITKLKLAKYDLIILDLMLPRGDSGLIRLDCCPKPLPVCRSRATDFRTPVDVVADSPLLSQRNQVLQVGRHTRGI